MVRKNDNNNTIPVHHDVKRQSGSGCQCKDGAPHPVSLPGSEVPPGNQGLQGEKGDTRMHEAIIAVTKSIISFVKSFVKKQ